MHICEFSVACWCRWNPTRGLPGATNLFIQLMDALYTTNPAMLFLVQGSNQVNLTGLGGSSYVTNIPVADLPANINADPNPFFKQVLVKPYASQVSRSCSLCVQLGLNF